MPRVCLAYASRMPRVCLAYASRYASAQYEMVFNARESRITIISDGSPLHPTTLRTALFPPPPSLPLSLPPPSLSLALSLSLSLSRSRSRSLSFSFRSFRCCIDRLRCLDAYAKYIFYGRTRERLSTEPRRARDVGFPFKAYPNNPPKVIERVFSWSKSRISRCAHFFGKRATAVDVNRWTLYRLKSIIQERAIACAAIDVPRNEQRTVERNDRYDLLVLLCARKASRHRQWRWSKRDVAWTKACPE